MSSFICRKYIKFIMFGAGFFLIPAIFVFAQTSEPAPSQAVFDDLSKLTGQEITRLEQAKAVCNVEQFITGCAEIGKKYGLYTADEQKQVDSVLSELKGKIVEDLQKCSTEECLIKVADQLARSFSSKNAALARQLDLTVAKVEEKKIIVETAKEIGVTVEQCRTMDPDTASIELLRSCARLAKDKRVQNYIPEDARRLADVSDTSLDLQEALRKGEYRCGDNTLDGCGNFCLNSTTSGTSAIPPVCRQIAEKFFGKDGVKELENAYTKVNSASDYYKKKAEAITFRTQDGRVLTNPADIGRYMEGEMKKGNVEAIEKGMDFMVARGFVQPEDRDFAIKMVRKAREQGGEIDFNRCESDPRACQNFVPEDQREEFNAMGEVRRIMDEEMRKLGVPSPESCENNPQYGEACVKAAKVALPQIEKIAEKLPSARFIVEDIRRHISFSDNAFEARKRAEEEFRRGDGGVKIGDKVFNNFVDMEAFCKTNGSLCLTEAAKQGFIEKDYAANRYKNTFESRSATGRVLPSGQIPGFTAPGPGFGQPPGFNKEEALKQFQLWLDNPVGPPPVPAHQSVPSGGPFYPQPSFCPAYSYPPPCPTGQYRPESRDERGCPSVGACISFSQTLPQQPSQPAQPICPQNQYWNGNSCVNSTVQCPQGQYWYVPSGNYNDGTGGYCKQNEQPTPTTGVCSPELKNLLGTDCHSMDNAFFNGPMTKYVTFGSSVLRECNINYARNCTTGSGTVVTCYGISTESSCRAVSSCVWYTNHYDGTHCDDVAHGQSGTTPTPVPTGQKEQVWNSLGLRSYIRSDADQARIDSLKQACASVPSGTNIWASGAGDYASPDFGMPVAEKCRTAATCAAGTYFNGTSCSGTTSTTCPSGQYWYVQSGGGSGYCKTTSTTDCPSGQYWSGTACVNNTVSTGGIQKCFYPNATKDGRNVGYTVWCEKDYFNCHEGSPSGATISLTGVSLGAPRFCESGWSNTIATTTTTTTTDCSTKYGSGWHSMDSSGTCFNTSMTEYRTTNGALYQCSATPTSGCSSTTTTTTSTTCPSGQWWNGTACTTSTTTTSSSCPSFAHEMSGYCMLNNDSTRCAEYPNASTDSGYTAAVCQSHQGTTTTTTTSCPSGQYWYVPSGGGAGYCRTTSTTDCPSGQYWSGTTCVTSTTTTSACNNNNVCDSGESSGSCPSDCSSTTTTNTTTTTSGCSTPSNCYDSSICTSSGWYWYSGGCWSSPQTTTTTTTTCPSDQYWNGTACVSSTPPSSFLPNDLCPRNHSWNGSYCIVKKQSIAHFFSQVRTSGRQFVGAIGAVFGLR